MYRPVASLAIAVLAFLTLAACGGSPAPSVAPSAAFATTPRPSVQPSASPTPGPSPTPSPLPDPSSESTSTAAPTAPIHASGVEPGLLAKTVTSDLRIRSKPGLGADSAELGTLLDKGAQLVVLDGPIEASGYDWFLVEPRAADDDGRILPTGWVAVAGKDGEPWIKPWNLECLPAPTNLDGLRKTASDLFLNCYRGVEITFNARLEQTAYACSGPEPIQPAWFGTCPGEYAINLVARNAVRRLVDIAWDPAVDLSIAARPGAPIEEWPTVRVTGQFDHPSARTCRAPNPGIPDDIHRAKTVLTCRNRFVVTEMRLIEE